VRIDFIIDLILTGFDSTSLLKNPSNVFLLEMRS